MSASAEVPLKRGTEIVANPSDDHVPCLKIDDEYYDVDIRLMKYIKEENVWIETELEDILDKEYVLVMESEISEIKAPREKWNKTITKKKLK